MRPLLAACLVAGCAEQGVEPRVLSPFQTHAWRTVTPGNDPMAAERPETFRCEGWWPEFDMLIVHTSDCDWLTVSQPARETLPAGAILRTQLEHGTLTADAPALGVARLWLGDWLVWELDARIPGPRAEHPIEVVLPRTLPAGTPLTFHVHNHGSNIWVVLPVEVEVLPQ